MNVIQLVGRVGREPKIFTTAAGAKIVSFSVATSESWLKGTERQVKTTWHNVKVFGKMAEVAAERVTKGCEVFVVGSMSYGEYEKDGAKIKTADVTLQGPQHLFRVLSEPKGEEGTAPKPAPAKRVDHEEGPDKLDDSIPF